MDIAEIFSQQNVQLDEQAGSKKRALEIVGEMIARSDSSLTSLGVFDALLARERLGSTGLGHGVAIPHGRIPGMEATVGVFVRLDQGVDFDAPDKQPVDLLFGLLVPEQSTDEHLQILSHLAERFSDTAVRDSLRAAASAEDVVRLLVKSVSHA